MKISRLMQVAFVNMIVAMPVLSVAAPLPAAPLPAVGSSAPISLCGEDKAEKGEKSETTEKADNNKKSDKKDTKKDSKGSA